MSLEPRAADELLFTGKATSMDPWPSYQQRVRRLLTLSLVAIATLALGAWRWPSLIALGIVLLTVAVIAVTALEALPVPTLRQAILSRRALSQLVFALLPAL